MTDTGVHLEQQALPGEPVRHWVYSSRWDRRAFDRPQIERLGRYIARPRLSQERLTRRAAAVCVGSRSLRPKPPPTD